MEMQKQQYTEQYKPISPLGYVAYAVLFTIPVIGWIFLLVFTFSGKNINRRNYARSYWVALVLMAGLLAALVGIEEYYGSLPRAFTTWTKAVTDVVARKSAPAKTEAPAAVEEAKTDAPVEAAKEEAEAPEKAAFETLKKGSKGDKVREVQEKLKALGYLTGSADGSYGAGTERAVSAFRADNGLGEGGEVDEAIYNAIMAAEAKPEPAEAETEKQEEKPAAKATGVTPSFKKAMDEYEAFFDEYIDFMKKLEKNPSDATLMMKSVDMLSRYEKTMKAMEDMDDGSLSEVDMAYYTQVTLRIEKKLLSVL